MKIVCTILSLILVGIGILNASVMSIEAKSIFHQFAGSFSLTNSLLGSIVVLLLGILFKEG